MKCPLLSMILYHREGYLPEGGAECLKEDCAWWEQDLNLCAIKAIALELRFTQLRLADMFDKMPHEEQFRK